MSLRGIVLLAGAILALIALALLTRQLSSTSSTTEQANVSTAGAMTTLERVRERGVLHCAIHTGQFGMSYLDEQGEWRGLFVDYCRALAAATIGNPDAVRFMPTAANKRFTVLQTGEADVLSRTTTWTLRRDVELGLNFTGVLFYDGQSFLVPRASGARSPRELDGATICISKGTTAEQNTADYFAAHGLRFRSLVFEQPEEARLAFFANRCDAMTTDAFTLTMIRLSDAERPDDFVVMEEAISNEPLGPVVRSDDEQWFDINKWVLNALIAAEDYRITRENANQMRDASRDPDVRRLLGVDPGLGQALGLEEEWAYRAIGSVGNYGEMYERHIAPLGVPRGLNQLYRDGGLMYPLPTR